MSLLEDDFSRLRSSEKLGVGRFCELRRYHYYGLADFDRSFAVKKLLPAEASKEESLKSVETEAGILALLRHPSIISPIDYTKDRETPLLILEYVSGIDLKRFADRYDQIPPQIFLLLAHRIAQGLKCVHEACDSSGISHEIIHRDISLGNIILSPHGFIKIIDFGSATSRCVSQPGSAYLFRNREPYLPPEALSGEGIDQTMDLFSLGVVLYRLVTGVMPFLGADPKEILEQVLNEKPQKPSKLNPKFNRFEDQIIMSCLNKKREKRMSCASELLEELEKGLGKRNQVNSDHVLAEYLKRQV